MHFGAWGLGREKRLAGEPVNTYTEANVTKKYTRHGDDRECTDRALKPPPTQLFLIILSYLYLYLYPIFTCTCTLSSPVFLSHLLASGTLNLSGYAYEPGCHLGK